MVIILKRIGVVVVTFVLLLIVSVYIISSIRWYRDYQNYDLLVETIPVSSDSTLVDRGEHIALTHYCRSCHGADLAGGFIVDNPMLAVIAAPNLTSGAGGVGATNSDEDWVRAIRHGIGHDGRGLIAMPSRIWYQMSTDDLAALIAYLKTIPAVDNELPTRQIGPLFRVLLTLGQAPLPEAKLIDHNAPRPTPPEVGVTSEYGKYLATSCSACHGADMSGGTVRTLDGELVTALNLTPGGDMQDWSLQDFITTLRTGFTPDNRQLLIAMPWPYIGQMTDEEMEAVWLYLQTLPALEQNLERTDF